jgi:hypothetical protein
MNRTSSSHPSPPVGQKVAEGRMRGISNGSWPQLVSAFGRCSLSMKRSFQTLNMKTKVPSDSAQKIATITKNFAVFAIFCSK